MSKKPYVDVRILKIELADISEEFAVGDNALVYIAQLEAEHAALKRGLKSIAKDEPPFETNEYALSLQKIARNTLFKEQT